MTELKNRKIYSYIIDNKLEIERIIKDYTNYIETIIKNNYLKLSDEDAEEIILDVFLAVWQNQNRLDINKNISSYIGGITHNLIKKKYRKYIVNENIEDYESQCIDLTNIEFDYLKNERNKLILKEIEKMKKEDKEIFVMYYYDERKIKDISVIFDMSEEKVKSKLFRIRKRLKKLFNDRGYRINEK